ncbi:PEP-CTERM sorting domain-containing protein [Massilia atriviolacea]|uniref:PEP-CTERM sorting domain-containing protein n=1 Tax=Massilia atriviolacea TaxID=2495579 RepID=A0A430HEI1_9BURK|nr:PEP-CTERM sorting domain-containing protein [Massilia atriviolacea]RSZ55919.1 PEP-CTERM sorting domain-containing protein [Massilia atriviolacea]
MNKFATSVVMAAALASPLLAHAQIRAEGSVTNFSYTLIDLLPDDGIAPSLTIAYRSNYPGASTASGEVSQNSTFEPWFTDSRSQFTTPFNRDVAASIGTRAGTASASTTGADFQSLQLHAAASTTSIAAASRAANGSASSTITEFVLSPGTQVSFFADFNAGTSTTLPAGNVLREYARTYASFSLNADAQDGWNGFTSTFSEAVASNWAFPNSPAATDSVSERLSLTLGNTSLFSSTLTLGISLSSTVQVYDASPVPPSPVPEPATTAMLLAGLTLVAGAARRRRKVQDQ